MVGGAKKQTVDDFAAATRLAGLLPDHTLKIADHERIWMRTERAAKQVVRIGDICYPVTQRFVNCIFQGARTGVNFSHFRAKQLHTKHIQRLATHVF